MTDTISALVSAIESRAWYPVTGFVVTLLIAAWRVVQPQVWERIPSAWKWLPALLVTVAAAFTEAFAAGLTWPVAVGVTVYALLTTWPVALGAAEISIRASGGRDG